MELQAKRDEERDKCEMCCKYKVHKEKTGLARACYKADAAISENKTLNDTHFASLDLQKVRMLPEIGGVKSAVFTQRICAYNESFSPLGKKTGKSVAILWHQGVAGRNDEDIASCFDRYLTHSIDRDVKHVVLWMDNCGPQNKNWTLFPAMVAIVNDPANHVESITFKYFEPGHTFMSADSFHHLVEKEATAKKNLYDFEDFVQCARNAGTCVLMGDNDFRQWQNELSDSLASKTSRPLLDNVVVSFFQKGSTDMFFKSAHSDAEFRSTDFLKKKFKVQVENGKVSPPVTKYNGVNAERKKSIIANLLSLMPENRKAFWLNMKANE